MEYRVLGELTALHDGEPVDLGTFRQRALLALLLTSPNAVQSTDQLIDALWGEDSGIDRQNSLWVYISGLRKALEPDRPKRTDGTILLTRSPGYLVQVDPDDIDAIRFERLVAEGRALTDTDPGAASLVLGEALALWRGRAYEDFTYESFAQSEIARLEELRLEAVQARIDADLRRGLSRELVSELETLVRQHPLREELTGQLMLALCRSGRQADALRAYAVLRSRLGEELGIEPTPRLRGIEEQIVTGEESAYDAPSHAGRAAPTPAASGLTIRGYELRNVIGEGAYGVAYRAYQPAVGREVAIKVIRPELADDPSFIRRFESEAQLIARLEHPHIVPLYDYWREPGAAYLVMRLMRGGSLSDVIDASALTAPQAARIATQLGGALSTAHRAGVVHRDVRPENVLFDDEGNAYLADFGIAIDASTDGDLGAAEQAPMRSMRAPYASPEELDAGNATPASDLYSMGVVVAQALTGMRGEPGQIQGALARPVVEVIERATAAELDTRYRSVSTFVADLTEALGSTDDVEIAPPAQMDNPYKGLCAFEAADAADFHGRERLVDRLVARLGEPGARGRFVAVVGPSGSGKSSVVRAGLLPALRSGALPRSEDWFTIEMTPAPHPYESLEAALRSVAVDPPGSLLETLVGSERGLVQAAKRVLPPGAQLVLLVDQFEELFTQVTPEISSRFVDLLVHSVLDDQSPIHVVATLRADFYDRPLRNRGLGELLRDGTQVVTPMTPEEAERAITGPLQELGVTIEPGLVAELVSDVLDRPGALPLLQYTLTELFDARTGNRITSESYEVLGGVSGALVTRAEALLDGLGDGAEDVARQVLLRLVTIGDGADDTRRRMLRSELDSLPVRRDLLAGVLDTFGRHRLLSFDRDPVTRGPTVEISHEALLHEWVRLRRWIDDAREDVQYQRRLAAAMQEWRASGERDDYLLRGGPLEQLHGWATVTTVPLTADEQAYLDASVTARDRAAATEIERERRAAEAEQRAQRRTRLLAGAGLACVLIGAAAVFGLLQWRSATEAREDNDSLVNAAEFVAASQIALDEDPELALLYGVEAVRSTADLGFATEDAVDAVHWALQAQGIEYPVGADAPVAVRSAPAGLAGVFVMAPADLVDHATASTTRSLTDEECARVSGRACTASSAIPADLPLRFGDENYDVDLPEVLPNGATFGIGPLAGTRITFAVSGAVAVSPGWEAEIARFTEQTGVEVRLVNNNDFEGTIALARGQLQATPDVVGFYSATPVWARPRAVDLSLFLDEASLRSDFGDHLIDLFTVPVESGGLELQSVPTNVGPKGLVYYPKAAFDEAGYAIPTTWDELIALSEQMVADGRTPWCFNWEGGFASGWPGSDFLESLVLRVGGVDAYDAWVAGDLAFDSQVVREAAALGDQLLFAPGYVRGGSEAISREPWQLPLVNLLDVDPWTGASGPQCWLVHQTYQQAGVLGEDTDLGPRGRLGTDVDFFPLPQLDDTDASLVVGGGFAATGLADRPEVRAFLRYVAEPTFGEAWASIAEPESRGIGDVFISPNRRFRLSAYRTEHGDAEDARVRVAMHEYSRAALDAGTWRFDMSDQMPPAFGTWTAELVPGPIWQGMIDWADQAKPIEEILADIEAARAEMDAAGEG